MQARRGRRACRSGQAGRRRWRRRGRRLEIEGDDGADDVVDERLAFGLATAAADQRTEFLELAVEFRVTSVVSESEAQDAALQADHGVRGRTVSRGFSCGAYGFGFARGAGHDLDSPVLCVDRPSARYGVRDDRGASRAAAGWP